MQVQQCCWLRAGINRSRNIPHIENLQIIPDQLDIVVGADGDGVAELAQHVGGGGAVQQGLVRLGLLLRARGVEGVAGAGHGQARALLAHGRSVAPNRVTDQVLCMTEINL